MGLIQDFLHLSWWQGWVSSGRNLEEMEKAQISRYLYFTVVIESP